MPMIHALRTLTRHPRTFLHANKLELNAPRWHSRGAAPILLTCAVLSPWKRFGCAVRDTFLDARTFEPVLQIPCDHIGSRETNARMPPNPTENLSPDQHVYMPD